MRPLKLKKSGPAELTVSWEDGHESRYSFEHLRDLCPCAECRGETVLFQTYVPPPPDRSVPGRCELKEIVQVGSYAVRLAWGDGHATGIYTWEYLLARCPCPEHAARPLNRTSTM